MEHCAFCDYAGPSPILADYGDAFVIEPTSPVTPGHVLVIPRRHVADFMEDPLVFAETAKTASLWCGVERIEDANIITSRGWAATQTVPHLHLHVVPRRREDRLAMPWSSPDFGPLESALVDFDHNGDYEGVVAAATPLVRTWRR